METNQTLEIIKHADHYTYGGVVVRKHKVDGSTTIGYAFQLVAINKDGRRVSNWQATKLKDAHDFVQYHINKGWTVRNGQLWSAKAIAKLSNQ